MTVLRETKLYQVTQENAIIRIRAKEQGVMRPELTLDLLILREAALWAELNSYSDSTFDTSCAIELGIGVFMQAGHE